MDILEPKAVVGTNSWGSAAYGKVLRGESVDQATIRKCYEKAKETGLLIFDLAQDYGLGKGQKMSAMKLIFHRKKKKLLEDEADRI